MTDLPRALLRAIDADPRIRSATVYLDDWVPNAYRWPAPGRCLAVTVQPDGNLATTEGTYDRKRSHAAGPYWVAFSARGGRLASA